MNPLVIVGSGLAGYTLVRELRRLDKAVPVVLLTRDGGSWYSKPTLSNALAAGKTADALALSTPAQMAAQLGIEVRTNVEVTRIVRESRELATSAGVLRYSSLVLALGADPVQLKVCDGVQGCHSVNDLEDYARFRLALEGARRVAILGGGLIGCEFANDLVASGCDVTVVEPGAWPLSRLVPEAVGRALQDALTGAGVTWRLGHVAERAARTQTGTRLHLSGDEIVEADIVLSAVGLRPRIALARAAGLKADHGIITARFLQTSETGVYALGDCAQVNGRHLPYVLPLMQCARALARTLAGELTAVNYPTMPVVVKTPALPVTIALPEPGARGTWCIEGTGRDLAASYLDTEGELAGFALTGAACGRKGALVRALDQRLEARSRKNESDTAAIATAAS